MSEEYSKEQIQAAADYINEMLNPILLPGMIQLPLFKHTLKKMNEQRSDIESAAAIIGPGYEVKSKQLSYQAKRMKALIELLEVYIEGEKDMVDIKQMKENREKVNKMFGID